MADAWEVRSAWGTSHFIVCEPQKLARLPIQSRDRTILEQVGLPLGPQSALTLNMRFENVQVLHSPGEVMALSESRFEKPPSYPMTGNPDVDTWARLDHFVVLGTVPNDMDPDSSWFQTRFLCLDGVTGRVAWVSPVPARGSTFCYPINSNLSAYLASLLAYKQFRDRWPELEDLYRRANNSSADPQYVDLANRIHTTFLAALEMADPDGFRGFWQEHAWNEAILLEI